MGKDLLSTQLANARLSMITVESPYSFDETVKRLKEKMYGLGAEVLAEIDHSTNAKKVGMELEPTVVIYFGNPKVGTILMQEVREIAYELPLRVVVWTSSGKTYVGFRKPSEIGKEYGIKNNDILKKMDSLMENILNI